MIRPLPAVYGEFSTVLPPTSLRQVFLNRKYSKRIGENAPFATALSTNKHLKPPPPPPYPHSTNGHSCYRTTPTPTNNIAAAPTDVAANGNKRHGPTDEGLVERYIAAHLLAGLAARTAEQLDVLYRPGAVDHLAEYYVLVVQPRGLSTRNHTKSVRMNHRVALGCTHSLQFEGRTVARGGGRAVPVGH